MSGSVVQGSAWLPAERSACQLLDRQDPLRSYGDRFDLPPNVIYLDGNSLGAMPRAIPATLQTAAAGWSTKLIRVWNDLDWHNLPARTGDRLSPLMGANPGEVLAADSTSINLYKLIFAALSLRPGRDVIVSERNNFPTDIHVLQGALRTSFPDKRLALASDDDDSVIALLGPDTAVVTLSHVNYRSGRLRDMGRITKSAHDAGALVIWDLCHSLGAVPVDLNAHGADFAVGCTYKYLNGGPGSPAWLFVAARHLPHVSSPLTGWQGHKDPFAFDIDYAPAGTIEKFRVGTPPVLSYLPLLDSLDIFAETDMAALRSKSLRLTDLFIHLVRTRLDGFGFGLLTPHEHRERGSQVALTHANAWPITQALIYAGVIGDFRAPDILRFGFAPLYVSFTDVWDAAEMLVGIMRTEKWREPHFAERKLVT